MKCPVCEGDFISESQDKKGNIFIECKWCNKGIREWIDDILRPLPKDYYVEVSWDYSEMEIRGMKVKFPTNRHRTLKEIEIK